MNMKTELQNILDNFDKITCDYLNGNKHHIFRNIIEGTELPSEIVEQLAHRSQQRDVILETIKKLDSLPAYEQKEEDRGRKYSSEDRSN